MTAVSSSWRGSSLPPLDGFFMYPVSMNTPISDLSFFLEDVRGETLQARVPEPGSALCLGAVLTGIAWLGRRRRR